MTPLVSLVQTTSYDLTPKHLRLPPIVWSTFTAFNRVHGVWRWYRRADLYRKPENLANLLAGHLLNWAIGDLMIVRMAAQCLLVATRILECSQQQMRLWHSGKNWIAALKGHYPSPIYVKWEKPSSNKSWLSPSTVYWWKSTTAALWERIKRIAYCTLDLFSKAFTLSMNIMDVVDAFCWSPMTKNDAVYESFVNIGKWMATIVDKKEELLEGLEDHKDLIKRILKNSPLTYEKLHAAVSGTLEKTEFVHQSMQKISTLGGGAVKKTGKRMLNGVFIVSGLANLTKGKTKVAV